MSVDALVDDCLVDHLLEGQLSVKREIHCAPAVDLTNSVTPSRNSTHGSTTQLLEYLQSPLKPPESLGTLALPQEVT